MDDQFLYPQNGQNPLINEKNSILQTIEQQPIYFVAILGLIMYSFLTFLFLNQNFSSITMNPKITYHQQKISQDDEIQKREIRKYFIRSNYRWRKEQYENMMQIRIAYVQAMNNKQRIAYINRRIQRQLSRTQCEFEVLDAYLDDTKTKFVTKSQILAIMFRIHKIVRQWPSFKEDLCGESPFYRVLSQTEQKQDNYYNNLFKQEESDEDRAIEYKKSICKKYFLTDNITDDGTVYYLKQINKENQSEDDILKTLYLPIEQVNKIQEVLNYDLYSQQEQECRVNDELKIIQKTQQEQTQSDNLIIEFDQENRIIEDQEQLDRKRFDREIEYLRPRQQDDEMMRRLCRITDKMQRKKKNKLNLFDR